MSNKKQKKTKKDLKMSNKKTKKNNFLPFYGI